MIRHNKPSTKFLQLTALLYVLQVTLADVKPDKLKTRKKGTKKKKEKKENKKGRKCDDYTCKNFVSYPLIADTITFILKETVRISKYSK